MFSTPLGLLALAGVPLVVALHLFQRRFPPREVSALFLWGRADTHSPAGRTRQPLVRSASFWFELLAALCLGLALGGPRAACTQEAGHLVVVLDSSASMAAVDPTVASDGPRGLDARARALVAERIGRLGANGRVTLVASGSRPSLVAGPAVTRAEARAALDGWRPGRGRHALTPAVSLARDLSGGGAVLLVTDTFRPDAWSEEVEVVALGTPLGNLALVGASRLATGGAERVTLTIANLAGADRRARLSLTTAEGPALELHREEVPIPAGDSERVTLDLPPDTPALVARLEDDELATDNTAWLAPAPDRRLGLASPLDPELRLALALDQPGDERPLARWLDLVPDSYPAPAPELADLVIAGAAPAGDRAWTLAVEAPGDERQELLGPFLKDLRDPALAGVTLEGIVWSHAPRHVPLGEPLVTVDRTALLSRSRDGARTTWHLSLDPRRSTLQRSPDWPVLLANLAEERRRALPGPAVTTLRTGGTLRFGAKAPARYRLDGPDGFARELSGGRTLLAEMPAVPGLYRLWRLPPGEATATAGDGTGEDADGGADEATAGGAPGASPGPPAGDATPGISGPPASPARAEQVALLAVNLADAAESDLSGLSSGTREARVALSRTDTRAAWLETLLALVALGLVLADGFVLGGHRLGRDLLPGRLDPGPTGQGPGPGDPEGPR